MHDPENARDRTGSGRVLALISFRVANSSLLRHRHPLGLAGACHRAGGRSFLDRYMSTTISPHWRPNYLISTKYRIAQRRLHRPNSLQWRSDVAASTRQPIGSVRGCDGDRSLLESPWTACTEISAMRRRGLGRRECIGIEASPTSPTLPRSLRCRPGMFQMAKTGRIVSV
jgi:hypothetical protein